MNPKINKPEDLAGNKSGAYEKPVIEVIEMEIEGCILQGSNFLPGGGWSN